MAFRGDEFISTFPVRMSFSGDVQISLNADCFLGFFNHLHMKSSAEQGLLQRLVID